MSNVDYIISCIRKCVGDEHFRECKKCGNDFMFDDSKDDICNTCLSDERCDLKSHLEINNLTEKECNNFWSKVNIPKDKAECWNWTACKRGGYGRIHIRRIGGMIAAHRISYTIHKGEIPNGMLVCHRCDNPACVNPGHLFLGTHEDNMLDMKTKGRANTSPQYGNNYAGRKVMAEGIWFKSYEEAARYVGISSNGIRKRIKLGWEGYSKA